MYDGSIKLVQDITVGDVLMGDDSTPRNVLSTCTGKETLYKVIPVKGDPFVCNESHIISLKTNNKTSIYGKGDVVDVCIKDYLNWSITQKHCAKLFRVGVEFEHHDTPIDPWLLGIWLAEGQKHDGGPILFINSLDTEIIHELSKYSTSVKDDNDRGTCKRVSLGTIGAAKNPFREEFRKCLSGKDVFICNEYKINSRTNRLKLLAGLLDGDGYTHHNHYEICTKFKTLSDDILFLARSLGMAAYMHIKYVNEVPYYRITISGELSDIPHILTRKKCHKREQIKDALCTGFSLENIGIGDYYGFEIDGNSRFVLGDFTVTHNTVIFSYIAQKSAAKGSRILVLTHRDELLSQTSGTLVDFGLSPKLINSKVKHPADGLLFVGMTGTLSNRLKKEEWRKWYESIDLVIIDELHEQQFNWIFDNALTKSKFVLGVSATPKRIGNQRQLSDDYDDMVLGPDMQELINMGYLVPDRYFSSPVDLSGVHKKAGEYDTEEMYSRYNKTELYSGIIDNWKRICPNTITIVFCCNIQHSINTCKAFNEAGIKAKFLVSDVANPILEINASKADLSKYNIKKEEYENYISNFTEYSGNRKEIVAQWKRGEFTVLVNAGIATTGFDFPQIETVILNRATTSDNLLLQMVGRGARIYPDKEFFYLLDFGENCSRLGYYRQQREYSLNHEVGKSGQGVPASKECPKCHALVFASSHICKYCGYVFPKSREERIVELKEIKYSEAVKELKTINDYELYQKSKGYNKHWLFRQIYIKFGKDGLVEYGKAHNMSPKWAYMEMAKYRAQGL